MKYTPLHISYREEAWDWLTNSPPVFPEETQTQTIESDDEEPNTSSRAESPLISSDKLDKMKERLKGMIVVIKDKKVDKSGNTGHSTPPISTGKVQYV